MTTLTEVGAVTARRRRTSRDTLVAAALALPILAVVLFAHGFVPGMVNAGTISFWTQGSIACTHDLGIEMLTSKCHAVGEPLGFPLLTGGPVILLGALFMYLPDVEPYGAYILSGAAFDAIALAGGYGLLRRLGAGPTIALLTAGAYLLSPTVIGMAGFGGTFEGFALLPAYAFVDLVVIDAIERRTGPALAVVLVGYAVLRTASLFLDGYSFVISAFVGACIWLAWGLQRERRRKVLLGAVAFIAANVVAAGFYELYVPGSFPTDRIEVFRSMGLDLVTVVVPSHLFWAADELGLSIVHADLWGDTTNAIYNYAGAACVVLAALYLARGPRNRSAIAIAVAGLIALVLALGPAVKVDEERSTPEVSYAMPEGLAPELPWGSLYVETPGLESMRATYRWFGVTRMALIVLAGLAVAGLARNRRLRVLAGVAGAIAVIELIPNLPLLTDGYERQDGDRNRFRADVMGDLRDATRDGERAFFLNYDGSHNDFLVNYMAPQVGVRAYNTGGDKNALFAIQRWPVEISALAAPGVSADTVAQAFAAGRADVVVAPFFHLDRSSYAWPPPPDVRAAAEAAFAPILADPRFEVDRHDWFATVREAG